MVSGERRSRMSDIIKREYNGIAIAFEGKEKISLTDMWKAAGSPPNQEPWRWLETEQAKNFIPAVIKKYNLAKNEVIKTTRGKNGGTWGHWQVSLTYAQYLSPDLHAFCNQIVGERVEEERNPELAITRGHERAIRTWKKQGKPDDWIAARIRTINAAKVNNRVLQRHGDDQYVFPMCANAMNRQILGMDAKEYKETNNLPTSARTRDFLDDIQLAELELASLVSARRIESDLIYGNLACAGVHETIAGRIHKAVNMRGV
jgi:hypothetical protein